MHFFIVYHEGARSGYSFVTISRNPSKMTFIVRALYDSELWDRIFGSCLSPAERSMTNLNSDSLIEQSLVVTT